MAYETIVSILAAVLLGGLLSAMAALKRARNEEEETLDLLTDAIQSNFALNKELAAIREQRSNGATYTADQVADWLRNLEAFASIGKMLAIKITGLWEVKSKLDADKAEKCLSCRKAITRDGSILFVPPEHRLCVTCILKATISKLEESECHHLHAATIGLLKEATELTWPPCGYDETRVYTRKPEGSLL